MTQMLTHLCQRVCFIKHFKTRKTSKGRRGEEGAFVNGCWLNNQNRCVLLSHFVQTESRGSECNERNKSGGFVPSSKFPTRSSTLHFSQRSEKKPWRVFGLFLWDKGESENSFCFLCGVSTLPQIHLSISFLSFLFLHQSLTL